MFLSMMITPQFQIRNPGNSGQLTSGQCFVTTHWVVSSQPANQIMPAHGASCKTSTWSHYQWLHSAFRSHDWSQFSCLLHLDFEFLKCDSSTCWLWPLTQGASPSSPRPRLVRGPIWVWGPPWVSPVSPSCTLSTVSGVSRISVMWLSVTTLSLWRLLSSPGVSLSTCSEPSQASYKLL